MSDVAHPGGSSTRPKVDISLFALAAAVGVALRLWLASRGHHVDMASWRDIADIVAQHRNVYAATIRYNYGPVWFIVLGALDWLHQTLGLSRFGAESFHLVVAGFLSLADIGIGTLLLRRFGLVPSLVMLLNPLSVLLTGYHSQFDNLAMLPALASWLLVESGSAGVGRVMLSAMLMALSLATKHFMFLFPVWIVFCSPLLPRLGVRLLYAIIAYGLFAGTFIPFAFEPGAWRSIQLNVIGYANFMASAFMPTMLDLAVPVRSLDSAFGLAPGVSIVRNLFHVFMLIAGWRLAARRPGDLFASYLLAVLIFTSVLHDQYLAIPVVVCAIHWRRPWSWVYLVLAAAVVQVSAYNVGVLPGPPWWRTFAPGLLPRHAVFWLLVLLISIRLGGGGLARTNRGKNQVRFDL